MEGGGGGLHICGDELPTQKRLEYLVKVKQNTTK